MVAPGTVNAHSRWGFESLLLYQIIALVTELVYVSVLETEFWEFESPLGHHNIITNNNIMIVSV